MLFIFEEEAPYTFWMKEMQFPLDLIWVGAQCTVVDITRDAPPPAPGQTLDELTRYTPKTSAQFVLEINGAESESRGIRQGDKVSFTGSLFGRYGC